MAVPPAFKHQNHTQAKPVFKLYRDFLFISYAMTQRFITNQQDFDFCLLTAHIFLSLEHELKKIPSLAPPAKESDRRTEMSLVWAPGSLWRSSSSLGMICNKTYSEHTVR